MKLTIFTPTYNRGYIIENLYRSLQRQTVMDFEWLVVDDGSTDDTAKLFEQWQREGNPFPIRYYYKENGGKCRAINDALDLAQGELFFTVDSDDYLTDDAAEKVLLWSYDLPENNKYCGFAGNLGTEVNQTGNTVAIEPYFDGTALDRYGKINGERAMVFFTEIHRHYKYPEFEGESFMTEAVTWNRMAADGYQMRFYNDIIWIYEYLEDGLTKAGNTLFLNNPKGYGLFLYEKANFQNWSSVRKLKMLYGFTFELRSKYDDKLISDSIHAPRWLIAVFRLILKFRHPEV